MGGGASVSRHRKAGRENLAKIAALNLIQKHPQKTGLQTNSGTFVPTIPRKTGV